MTTYNEGDRVVYMPHGALMPENGTVVIPPGHKKRTGPGTWVTSGDGYVFVRYDGQEHAKATRVADLKPEEPKGCNGACLSGYDVGVDFGGIAYPHPDCPEHGDDWTPSDNEWSREYVADHPERFGGQR